MNISSPDYEEAVYAGVLGKIIGVYAGRPIEGWSHARILERLGEIDRYVADELGQPLVVSDDDISGTFTFLRALADNDDDANLSPRQIGETWLNYLIEGKTVLWWGGIGMSTEHTAFLRLKEGIAAPESGSIETNGASVAEQIGAQIFIEGWGLIHPGEPKEAADFARRAASVSHDREAIYAAQVIAVIVAMAFVEKSVDKLLDHAVEAIPKNCAIAHLIASIRAWKEHGLDWRAAFKRLEADHGYDRYPGNCHVIPNHGVVILSLLYGEGDFSQSIKIANTCGWDTDCNSGNVGCIVGVLGGLKGIDAGTGTDAAHDWRGPVEDRILLPTADGGRTVTDAVLESQRIVRSARALHRLPLTDSAANPRFSFPFPGAVQGFRGENARVDHRSGGLSIELAKQRGSAMTSTFPTAEERKATGYKVVASPTLNSGQTVRAKLTANRRSVRVGVRLDSFRDCDESFTLPVEYVAIAGGQTLEIAATVPPLDGYPVHRVGIALEGEAGDDVLLHWLTWEGTPKVQLARCPNGETWRDAWVAGVDDFQTWTNPPAAVQNTGTGLLIYGCREWTDLRVDARLRFDLARSGGIAVRVQGMQRYYALLITASGTAQLVKRRGTTTVLDECPFSWSFGDTIDLRLSVVSNHLVGAVNGTHRLSAHDGTLPLADGAVAIIVNEGRIGFERFRIGEADR